MSDSEEYLSSVENEEGPEEPIGSFSSKDQAQIETFNAMKEHLRPHEDTFDVCQLILFWKTKYAIGAFIVLCILFHIALSLIFSIASTLSVISFTSLALASWFLIGLILQNTVIPSASLKSLLSQGSDSAPPLYTLDDIVALVLDVQSGINTLKTELSLLYNHHYTRFVLQISAIFVSIAFVGSYISDFWVCWLVAYTLLLLPGLYSHGVFNKGKRVLLPYVSKLMDMTNSTVHSAAVSVPKKKKEE